MKKKIEMEIIYSSALEVFSKYGYRKTSLEDIGQTLNMTKSNLYHYAGSKLELYHNTVIYTLEKWHDAVKEKIEQKDNPYDKLKYMCDASLEYTRENPVVIGLLQNDPELGSPIFAPEIYKPAYDKAKEMIREILEEGKKSGLFRPLNMKEISELMYTLYQLFIRVGYVGGNLNFVSNYYSTIVDLMMNGIMKR